MVLSPKEFLQDQQYPLVLHLSILHHFHYLMMIESTKKVLNHNN